MSIPLSVAPHTVVSSVWIISPAYAMARPPREGDENIGPPEVHPPISIVPEELTSHIGSCLAGPPVDLTPPPDREIHWSVARLAAAKATRNSTGTEGWLGVSVYTPHYRPVSFAVLPGPLPSAAQSTIDIVTASQYGVPQGLFDTVVPIRPQRASGFASFIRFSSNIRRFGGGEGMAAVIADLTQAGGPYFATTLPRSLSYEDLCSYLQPLTRHRAEELRYFVGLRTKPWPSCAMVQLRDGDVITVLSGHEAEVQRLRFADLFSLDVEYGSLHDMATPEVNEAICVLHREQRFCFPCPGSDRSIEQNIVADLRLDPNAVQMCKFPIADLDVQGSQCSLLVAVQDLPPPSTLAAQQIAARHIFVLLDFRPLGLKPRFVCTTYPALHIPSLASRFEIVLPESRVLAVYGGERIRNDVHIDGNTTLVFFADEPPPPRDDFESSSDDGLADRFPIRLPAGPPVPAPVAHDVPSSPVWEAEWPGTAEPISAWDEHFHPAQMPIPRQNNDENSNDLPPWDETVQDTHATAHVWEDEWLNDDASLPGAPAPTSVSLPQAAQASSDLDPPGAGSIVAEPTRLRITAFVAVPDYIPERHTLVLPVPCGVGLLIDALQSDRRSQNWGTMTCCDTVVPVFPQPSNKFATFVGFPSCISGKVVAFFNCHHVDSRAFASPVWDSLTRESILLAAGYGGDSRHNVFVHGIMHPLAEGQRISLYNGILINITPQSSGSPDVFDLATMLQQVDGWDAGAYLPCPRWCHRSHFCVLTDAWPMLFAVREPSRGFSRDDLADLLQTQECKLVIRPSAPRLSDVLFRGYPVSGVLVATEAVSNLPCPPAKSKDTRKILILDQPPILRGFSWRLQDHDLLPVQMLADEFADLCPSGYSVVFRGASVLRVGGRLVMVIGNGQVVSVEFVPDQVQRDDPNEAPPDDDDMHEGGDGDHRNEGQDSLPSDVHSVSEPPSASQGTAREPASDRSRSRSPRDSTGANDTARSSHAVLQLDLTSGSKAPALTLDRPHKGIRRIGNPTYMWSSVVLHDALAEGMRCLTSVLPHPLGPQALRICGPSLAKNTAGEGTHGQGHIVCKILPSQGASHLSSSEAFRNARRATLQLGLPWPFEPNFPVDMVQDETEAFPLEQVEEEETMVQAVFLLLTPDYKPETLVLELLVPQSLLEVIDLIDTCRNRRLRSLFPQVIPVIPQPDPRWGLFIALPTWIRDEIVVCLDLTLVDGRVFSAVTPRATDKPSLLNLAGFAIGALMDVYIPGDPDPVEAEVHLSMGPCVSFVPSGEPREYMTHLEDLLRTHLGWAPGPAFPQPDGHDRICAVADGWYRDFLLLPERANFFRADLATRFGIPLLRLLIHAAIPIPGDVTIYGRACCTVVGLSESPRRDPDAAQTTALIDCRPLLEGWRKEIAPDGWLDVATLRFKLLQGAPAGYTVVFSGCRPHWNWLAVENGQVVVATLVASNLSVSDEGQDSHNSFGLGPDSPNSQPSADDLDRSPPVDGDDQGTGSDRNAPVSRGWSFGNSLATHISDTRFDQTVWSWSVMCAQGLLHHAFLTGTLGITSVFMLLYAGSLLGAHLTVHVCVRIGRVQMPVLFGLLMLQLLVWPSDAMQLPSRHDSDVVEYDPSCLSRCAGSFPAGDTRPIATPCRGIIQCPIIDLDGDMLSSLVDDIGPTLLEECVQHPECEAFFLAVSLIEVLFEHFSAPSFELPHASLPVYQLDGAQDPVTTIFLDLLLPDNSRAANTNAACWYPLDCGQCEIPLTQSMWDNLCRSVPLCCASSMPQGLHKPERFKDWIAFGTPGILPHDSEALGVFFTADGSYSPSHRGCRMGSRYFLCHAPVPRSTRRSLGTDCWSYG